jgi:hypothetical protein
MKFEENLGLAGKTRKKRAKKGAKKRKPATRRFYYKKIRKEGMEPTVETDDQKGGGLLEKLGEWGDFLTSGKFPSSGTNTASQANNPETPMAMKPLKRNSKAMNINTYIKLRNPNEKNVKNGKKEFPPYDIGSETILPQKNNVETVNRFFRMMMGTKNGKKEEWKRQRISTKDIYLPPEIKTDANGKETVLPNKNPKHKSEISVMKNKMEITDVSREVIKDPNDTLRDVIPGIMGEETRKYLNTENIELGGDETEEPAPVSESNSVVSPVSPVERQIPETNVLVNVPQPEQTITKTVPEKIIKIINPGPVIQRGNNEPITTLKPEPESKDDDEELKLAILLATMDTTPPSEVVDIKPDTPPPSPKENPKDCDCDELTEQIKGILDDYFKKFEEKMKNNIPRPDDDRRYDNRRYDDDDNKSRPKNRQIIGQNDGQIIGQDDGQNDGPDGETNIGQIIGQDDNVYDTDGNKIIPIPIAEPYRPYKEPAVYSTDYNNTVNYEKDDIILSTEPAHESKLVINNETYKDSKHVLPSYSSQNIVNITPSQSKPQEHFTPPNNININIKEKG